MEIVLSRKDNSNSYGFVPYFQGTKVDRPLRIRCTRDTISVVWKRDGFEDIKAIYPISSDNVLIGSIPADKIIKIFTIEDLRIIGLNETVLPVSSNSVKIFIDGIRLEDDSRILIPYNDLKEKVLEIYFKPGLGYKDYKDKGVLFSSDFPIAILAEPFQKEYIFEGYYQDDSFVRIKFEIAGQDFLSASPEECPIKGFKLQSPLKSDKTANKIIPVPQAKHTSPDCPTISNKSSIAHSFSEQSAHTIRHIDKVNTIPSQSGTIPPTKSITDSVKDEKAGGKGMTVLIWTLIIFMVSVLLFGMIYFLFPGFLGLQDKSTLLDSDTTEAVAEDPEGSPSEEEILEACDYLDNSSVWMNDKMEKNRALAGLYSALNSFNWKEIIRYQQYLDRSKKFRDLKELAIKMTSMDDTQTAFPKDKPYVNSSSIIYSEYIDCIKEMITKAEQQSLENTDSEEQPADAANQESEDPGSDEIGE